MHIFFSGIGGTAIGPLALIAKQAGYEVSGSDKQDSQYIEYLKKHGITDIHIGQTGEKIAAVHHEKPIDWFVYSSALPLENPDHTELKFCEDQQIRATKRDELLNRIITDKNLTLIAIAGTHGKTTTTAMAIWLAKQLDLPVSYSVGAKISFGEMGEYAGENSYFIYEADEFDHNFLAFKPEISLITGIDWDHHEIFKSRNDYKAAFRQFLDQTNHSVMWQKDLEYLGGIPGPDDIVLTETAAGLTLLGEVNRADATLVLQAFKPFGLTEKSQDQLVQIMNQFPGLNRRFERITNRLYSDYAHTEEKIKGALQTASEASKNVVVVYEPLTDRRQHFIKKAYKDLFNGVKKLYWVPSYLAREDPDQPVLSPKELIAHMGNKEIAEPAVLNEELKEQIMNHLSEGDLVLCLSGGGGGSLDEWLRHNFS